MIEIVNEGGVLEIVLDNPPVNAMAAVVRQSVVAAIKAAQSDESVNAVVIRGSGRFFSAGADLTEFDKPILQPTLSEVVNTIEASTKPVVAAIHGMALGGGLEVALGCHYRIAAATAMVGLPEVKLGLLPGAGGTQRLPRLIGMVSALEMIVAGNPIAAVKAHELGLVDRVVSEEALVSDARAYARTLREVRRTGDRSVTVDDSALKRFLSANEKKISVFDAPASCIEAVRAAAEMPLAAGLKREQGLFEKLVSGEQSKGLRHVFFSERAASTVEGMPKDVQARPLRRIGVIGAGTMGGGIAMCFLSAGLPVTLVDMSQEALDRGVSTVRKNYESSAAKGRINSIQVASAMALLTATTALDRLSESDLIIEAVYENMDLKKDLFSRLDRIAKPGAVLASNTSYLSIDEIASVTRRPQDVLGLHFFSPANVMKLLEVVRGRETSSEVLATGMSVSRKIGKVPVVARVCYGFIGNRMLVPRFDHAFKLIGEGATPEQIDRVSTNLGLPVGPFEMADLAGIDIGWHRDPSRIESLFDALCAKGRFGQKVKAGFYDYDDRRKAVSSPAAAEIISDFRERFGSAARPISDEEILVRTMYTLVNEGAKIVEERIAQRLSDVDVVYVYGYGWPASMGGPMYWADRIGARTIVDAFKKYEKELGPDFVIAPLLRRSADEGKPLAEISR